MSKDGFNLRIITYMFCYTLIAILVISCFAIAVNRRHKYQTIYQESVRLFEVGDADDALEKIKEIPDYKNYKGVPDLLAKYDVCPECGQDID